MKKRNLKTLICCLMAVGMITLFGCEKKTTPVDSDTTVATENTTIQEETNNVLNAANSIYHDRSGNRVMAGYSLLPSCATLSGISFDSIALVDSPGVHKIVIDFGQAGCQCTNWDNKYRKGQIIANWTGGYRDSLNVITLTTNNYCVSQDNGIHYDTMHLTFTITNNGINAVGNPTYSAHIVAGYVTDSGTISLTSDVNIIWIAGYNPVTTLINPLATQITMSGTAIGTTTTGVSYNVAITTPLQFDVNCKYNIVAGAATITEGTLAPRYVTFGSGTCSGQATVEIGGTFYTINL